MRRLGVVVAIACAAALGVADEIRLNYVRPSRVLAILARAPIGSLLDEIVGKKDSTGAIPAGLRVKADDLKSVLIVYGDAAETEALAREVAQLDIQPKLLRTAIELTAPLEGYHSTTTTLIQDGNSWAMADGATGIKFGLASKLNPDGTVTLTFTVGPKTQPQRFSVRVPFGKPVDVVFDDLLSGHALAEPIAIADVDKRILVGKPTPDSAIVTVRTTLVENAKIK